jgi:multidrug/hemolysin transport system permease protein
LYKHLIGKVLNAYSLFNSILGTLIGFLAGILIPIGGLSSVFQTVVKVFPFSHSASLFRRILMEEPIKIVFEWAEPSTVQNFRQTMGIDLMFNGSPITDSASILYLIILGVVCLVISIVSLKRKA